MTKSGYDTTFKLEVVKSFLLKKKDNPNLTAPVFCAENYPQLNARYIGCWLRHYRSVAARESGMSENESKGVYGSAANELPLADKYRILKETAGLKGEEPGEYCRKHGLYQSDMERWDQELTSALSEKPASVSGEVRALRQELKDAQVKPGKKDREILRKDKALSEYAARIILMQNFQNLFADKKDD